MSFTDRLLEHYDSLWDRMIQHPFLESIRDGVLEDETFHRWLRQRYEFVRAVLPFLAALKSKALPHHQAPLAEAEMALHQKLELFEECASSLGVDLEDVSRNLTTQSYIQHLIATAYREDYAVSMTVYWAAENAYHEAWKRVLPALEPDHPWYPLVENWTGEEFAGFVYFLTSFVDELAGEASDRQRRQMEEHFTWTIRYEIAFWDVGYGRAGNEWLTEHPFTSGEGFDDGRGKSPGNLTDRLHERVKPLWDAQLEHPFVRGIADGTLEVERFRNWVEQDYRFLKEYARVFAWAAAKARKLEPMGWYADMLDLTLNTEMDLHRDYAARFDVTEDELESVDMWPTTRAYTDFLVRTAADGDMCDLLAALLPCTWGYAHIGQNLAEEELPKDERYAEWIKTYSSDEFVEGAEWLKSEINRLGDSLPDHRKDDLEELFVTSSRYEYRFWDMCYGGEGWDTPNAS